MRRLKKWYTYQRNGIIYVQLKDKKTGKKLTAKSTRTRDKEQAECIINELFYNPQSDFNKSQREKEKELFTPIIQEAVKNAIKALPINLTGKADRQPAADASVVGNAAPQSSYPAEIRPLADQLNTLTFYEYLMLFWDYDNSPYIKQLTRLGKKIPNPERFYARFKAFKRYASLFGDTKLAEITADELNTVLGCIKKS